MAPSLTPLSQAETALQSHMAAGAVAGLIPIPLVGFAALTAVQLNMLRHLAEIYSAEFSKEIAKSAIASLVGSDLSVGISLGVAKLLPGPAVAISAVSGAILGTASTYALGKVFIQHFESGNTFLTFDPSKVRAHYQELFSVSKSEHVPGRFVGIRP